MAKWDERARRKLGPRSVTREPESGGKASVVSSKSFDVNEARSFFFSSFWLQCFARKQRLPNSYSHVDAPTRSDSICYEQMPRTGGVSGSLIGHCKAKKERGRDIIGYRGRRSNPPVALPPSLPPFLSAPPPPPLRPKLQLIWEREGGERERERKRGGEAGPHHDNMRCPPTAGFRFLSAGLFTQPVESSTAPDDRRGIGSSGLHVHASV